MKKFTIDQIIRILAEADSPGNSVAAIARKYGISEQTIYRWRKKYRGFSSSEAKRLKALEEENARLKRLLAEKELEIQALTQVIKKNF
ncbi:transposase [Thermosulfurimonas sp. F29]|uniref:transposase n=1 Tax=Thermosulfurimonas sp. F29 TaxID=2867247 RepID=UPI001C83A305|nr:transposase [Thermosulfurimonas sp. F29]MBX6424298.1 transposase [Thermosulfurimonas sp. F29]